MKQIIWAMLLFISSDMCFSQSVELYCKGNISGDFEPEEAEFALKVSFSKPDFWGVPNGYVMGCTKIANENPIISCSASSNSLSCTCSNSAVQTSLILSRVTGRLLIDNHHLEDMKRSKGVYQCEKIASRKF